MSKQKVCFIAVAALGSCFLQAQQVVSSKATIMNPEEFVKFATVASPYEVLGIANTTNEKIITEAFEKLNSQYRPSKWPNQEQTARQALKVIAHARVVAFKGNQNALSNILAEAIAHENNDLVKTILSTGVDLNARDALGWTALVAASGSGNVALVKMLLAAGANPLLEGIYTKSIRGTPRDVAQQQLKEMETWAYITIEKAKEREDNMNEVIKILAAAEENWPAKRMGLPEKAVGASKAVKETVAKRVTGREEAHAQNISNIIGRKISNYL